MNHNLDEKPCPRCRSSGWLVFQTQAREIVCQKCHARFRVTLPPLPEPVRMSTVTTLPPRFGSDDVVDYYTQTDAGGNIHRVEVSKYHIPTVPAPAREFDPNNNHTAFILYLLADKAKNRRRYNRDIVKRFRRNMIARIELDEIKE